MQHRMIRTLVGTFAFAAVALAQAQHSSTTEGTGVFVEANRVSNLRQAVVNLERGGRLTIDLISERGRVRLDGTWRDNRDNRYQISLRAPNSRNLQMEGSIDVADGYVRQIYADASTNNERWMINFRGTPRGGQSGGNGGDNGGYGDQNDGYGRPGDNRYFQPIELRTNMRGQGQFTFGYENARPQSTNVEFRRDGRVFIVFNASRQYTLVANYGNTNGLSIPITVIDGLGRRDVRGQGNIQLSHDRQRVERVNVSGTADGQRYQFEFSNGFGRRDETVYGRGTLTFGRVRVEANSVRVILIPNGRFTIRNGDRSNYEWNGNWTEQNGSISLRIDDVDGHHEASGRGTIRVDNRTNEITSVDLSGRSDRDSFNLSFRVTDDWNNGRGNGNGNGRGNGNGNGNGRGNGNGNGNGRGNGNGGN